VRHSLLDRAAQLAQVVRQSLAPRVVLAAIMPQPLILHSNCYPMLYVEKKSLLAKVTVSNLPGTGCKLLPLSSSTVDAIRASILS